MERLQVVAADTTGFRVRIAVVNDDRTVAVAYGFRQVDGVAVDHVVIRHTVNPEGGPCRLLIGTCTQSPVGDVETTQAIEAEPGALENLWDYLAGLL